MEAIQPRICIRRKICPNPKVGLNFRRLYLHNHLEFEAPVKVWLVNAATFNATEPTCVGLEGTNYIYVDLLFFFFRKATTWLHYLWSSRKGLMGVKGGSVYLYIILVISMCVWKKKIKDAWHSLTIIRGATTICKYLLCNFFGTYCQ